MTEARLPPPSQTEQTSVGHGITVPASGWSFGGNVWRHFDQHIRASVPGYDLVHDTILDLGQGFLGPGKRACDLGCSTGTLTARLANQFRGVEVVGVDIEPSMIAAAKRLSPHRPTYRCGDVRDIELPRLEFACACYTLMFLPPRDRLDVLRRVFGALGPGGGFVLAEKVLREDPIHEAHCQRQHYAFKRRQGLSEQEIALKARSIEGCLIPLTDQENVALLRDAGFAEIQLVFRSACFDAWVAVRPR
ncbi:MAG TPA: methyltransferase domain-containing protein [Polyangiaceae bacterium]|nr:methyltransferase domain-containing protein [Polyangiaceae bacterium]